jgi:hypothetical protein
MLLLGHSVLPHNHSNKEQFRSKISDGTTLSFFDILKYTLANDLGANHLEEYNRGSNSNFSFFTDFNFLFCEGSMPYQTELPFIYIRNQFANVDFKLKSQWNIYCLGLRAPPALV